MPGTASIDADQRYVVELKIVGGFNAEETQSFQGKYAAFRTEVQATMGNAVSPSATAPQGTLIIDVAGPLFADNASSQYFGKFDKMLRDFMNDIRNMGKNVTWDNAYVRDIKKWKKKR